MILADTSVWVQHFRRGIADFSGRLHRGEISTHPVVIGELAMGNLADRKGTLAILVSLPHTAVASARECLAFIENHSLNGRGMGWSDLQLLVAARLSGHPLWTTDRRLAESAENLGVSFRSS